MRLSEALVFFRASGDNCLRSITRAVVNKHVGKRKIVFVDVILKLSEALGFFRASGDNFLRSITRAIVNKNVGKRKIDLLLSGCFKTFPGCFGFWMFFLTTLTGIPFWSFVSQHFCLL